MHKNRLTNKQRSAMGLKRTDNGEINHSAEKVAFNRKNDNVKPEL
ncbi:hypothetical protein [Clostridium omnivorum]|uniref:Uncharacterized protein n=1 Tax=Clostridium omnivorum TaxID=1604902 RepID=A0ABQ5NBY5_9CLOT|nr:hypothetical protein [Clostridium sp. E14]GLC32775.1 hypothetical protein bsdE14_41850 [Clostridium sp. E14]